MIKRTIEISREPAHLAVRNEQLTLRRDGAVVGQAPCEDLGVVVVDHPQATYSHHALTKLADAGAVVVLCGRDHLPAALVLPIADHTQVVWRLADQINASRPLKKRLWQQLVVAKVRAQAFNLSGRLPAHRKLLAMAQEVRSGDPTNVEAHAAKLYWRSWLHDAGDHHDNPFRRDTDGAGLNAFLNYGYAVLRAAVARALVAAGLEPRLGLHHASRGNAFCLADDLMEPFRPLVDDRVREMYRQGYDTLNQPAKAELLGLLAEPMQITTRPTGTGEAAPQPNSAPQPTQQTGPLMVMLHRVAASLVRCYAGESKRLDLPEPLKPDAEPPAPGAGQQRHPTTNGGPPCGSQATD
ncbi:MAG: type II CRISPR-associated endonuclease Cas1 [Planctomycetota bacterium]